MQDLIFVRRKFVREDLMSILLVLWVLLNSETSKTFADSSSLDGKEQAHQNSGFEGVYFETEAERSIGC